MKARLAIIILILLWSQAKGQTLIDSYSESNTSSGVYLYSSSYTSYGNSFTNSNECTLGSCKFYLRKSGSPTGSAFAKLYSITGAYGVTSTPSGSALAVSDAFDVSTLTTSNQLISFTFSGANQITLTASTKYFIVCEFTSGDASNYVRVNNDATSSTHSGNSARYLSSWGYQTSDCIFYVYTSSGVTTSVKAINGVTQATVSKVAGVTMSGVKKFNGVANQ